MTYDNSTHSQTPFSYLSNRTDWEYKQGWKVSEGYGGTLSSVTFYCGQGTSTDNVGPFTCKVARGASQDTEYTSTNSYGADDIADFGSDMTALVFAFDNVDIDVDDVIYIQTDDTSTASYVRLAMGGATAVDGQTVHQYVTGTDGTGDWDNSTKPLAMIASTAASGRSTRDPPPPFNLESF